MSFASLPHALPLDRSAEPIPVYDLRNEDFQIMHDIGDDVSDAAGEGTLKAFSSREAHPDRSGRVSASAFLPPTKLRRERRR